MAIKKVDKGLYTCLTSDIRKSNPSRFGNGATIYVKPSAKADYKYIIFLKKGKYKTFSLESRVQDAKTGKPLTTPGNRKGMQPYFIDDFLGR